MECIIQSIRNTIQDTDTIVQNISSIVQTKQLNS